MKEMESGWIPVTESLPEQGQWVIVTVQEDDGERYTTPSMRPQYNWWDVYVIAWMPLPEPYEPEGQENG